MPLVTFDDRNVANYQAYSTSELDTGCTWTNGKPIYRKVVVMGTLPNTTSLVVSHGITNIDEMITVRGFAKSNDGAVIPLPFAGSSTSTVTLSANTTSITSWTNNDRRSYTATAILEYTKTTD